MGTSSSSGIAAIVLAHNDAPQLRRLFAALEDAEIFLHCDLATSERDFSEMVAGKSDAVTVLPRMRTTRWSWSLVEAELRALRAVLDASAAEYIVLMSGSCYPLLTIDEIAAELAATPGMSRLNFTRLPHAPWNDRLGLEGGLWRLGLRYVYIRGRVLNVRGIPIPVGRRTIPSALVPHGGSQWKVYSREHARQLLAVLDAHPELLRFFATSFVPDETCVHTILNSPELVGETAEALRSSDPWFLEQAADTQEARAEQGHAHWLTESALGPMLAARAAPDAGRGHLQRALFARKFRSQDGAVLDQLDGARYGA